MVLLVLVAIIWVAAAELIQQVYGQLHYEKPIFVTYFSSSIFAFFLFGFLRPSWRAKLHTPLNDAHAFAEAHDLGHSDSGPVAGARTSVFDTPKYFSVDRVMRIGFLLSVPFFLSNVLFNIGLEWTSVSSSSTISTMSTLFTLVLGAMFNIERFSWVKFFATMVSISGVALVSYFDNMRDTSDKSGTESLTGDMICIFSAFVYAIYALLLKKESGDSGEMDMGMMLGFLGFFNLVAFWPFLVASHLFKWETFVFPSLTVWVMLLFNGFIGTLLSEFLLAKSVVLTTPLIGTLSLSLTVPFSFVVDTLWRKHKFGWGYMTGAGLVLVAFALVNWDEAVERRKIKKDAETKKLALLQEVHTRADSEMDL